jgi:hypothetical protein
MPNYVFMIWMAATQCVEDAYKWEAWAVRKFEASIFVPILADLA